MRRRERGVTLIELLIGATLAGALVGARVGLDGLPQEWVAEIERAGDLSGLRDSAGNVIPVYDPTTTVGHERTQFGANVIPASRLDPVARAVLSYYPMPNRIGNAAGANNFGNNADSSLGRNIVVARLDHEFRATDQVSARYYINDSGIQNAGSFGRPAADPDALQTDARLQSIMLSHSHVFRPSVINELKVSFLQRKYLERRYGAGESLAASLGLTGVSDAAFPIFTVPGYVG